MVKVYGPMMSLDASGTVADAITFSKWKGRNYVRQRVVPANPQSPLQTGFRAMMSGLSKAWAVLLASYGANWDDLAKATSISAFNAFVQFNQTRWGQYKPPVVDPDDTDESGSALTITSQTATAGVNSVTCQIVIDAIHDGLGWLVHRSTVDGFTPSNATLVYALFQRNSGTFTWIDTPLEAGTYYYKFWKSTIDGAYGAMGAQLSAVVP